MSQTDIKKTAVFAKTTHEAAKIIGAYKMLGAAGDEHISIVPEIYIGVDEYNNMFQCSLFEILFKNGYQTYKIDDLIEMIEEKEKRKRDAFIPLASEPTSHYPKLMLVSHGGENWIKRVVFAEKKHRSGKPVYIAWTGASTIEEAEKVLDTSDWNHAKDIEPEPEILSFSIQSAREMIAKSLDKKPEQIEIRIFNVPSEKGIEPPVNM